MAQGQKEFDGDLRQLAPMRAFLREVCSQSWHAEPGDDDLSGRLALALTEAASNIIRHGFGGQPLKSITLTVQADDDQVCVTLQHAGKPFDPQTVAAPVFDGSQEGGFGLYLIRKCVDEVRYYQDTEGRCVVHLVQKRKRQQGEDHEDRS